MKDRVISLYKDKYNGFGPTFATEKLLERDKIQVSRETLRQWLKEKGLWDRHRKSRGHQKNRPRKECYGDMVILNGSHHDWFEGRGPKLVLMAYIDDATSKLYGRFYDYEGTIPAMDSFKRYIKKYGIPQSIYTDRHTTYKSPKKATIEDELAKGRVERVFNTLQDRLVKEMRLRNIKTKDEANRYLRYYLPEHNKRFTVPPFNRSNAHRRIPEGIDIDTILCIREKRTIRRDWTIRYNNRFYQITKVPGGLKPKYVWVEERVNGKKFISYKGFYLSFKEIEVRLPEKKRVSKRKRVALKKKYIPPKDHPWRSFKLPSAVMKERNRQKKEVQKR